jgi:hypothetical protein
VDQGFGGTGRHGGADSSRPNHAWLALGTGAFMAAAAAFVMFVAVDIARRDARLVARRRAEAGRP